MFGTKKGEIVLVCLGYKESDNEPWVFVKNSSSFWTHWERDMRVKIDRDKNVIMLDQEQYIVQILKWFTMRDWKSVSTPMDS